VKISKIPANGPTWRAVSSYVKSGVTLVGIDEVGRGAWAGPVVAAAVVLKPGCKLQHLDDSKRVTPLRRAELNRQIRRQALGVGLGWVSPSDVDRHGLSWAIKQSGLRALSACNVAPGPYMVILDGRHNYLLGERPSIVIVKGDQLVVPVSAASIIAKVARDRYMSLLERRYPGYNMASHKGYGTKEHIAALFRLGPSPIHRLSYAPVRALLPD
jgi:ribonuclease HII